MKKSSVFAPFALGLALALSVGSTASADNPAPAASSQKKNYRIVVSTKVSKAQVKIYYFDASSKKEAEQLATEQFGKDEPTLAPHVTYETIINPN